MKIFNGSPSVGEMIKELYLLPTGIKVEEAAGLCEIDTEMFMKILNNEQIIGYELAHKLGKGFNTTHNFWLNIQKNYLDTKGK